MFKHFYPSYLGLSFVLAACGDPSAMEFDIESAGRLLPGSSVSTSEQVDSPLTQSAEEMDFESADLSATDVGEVFDAILNEDDCDEACAQELNIATAADLDSSSATSGGASDDAGTETKNIEIITSADEYSLPNNSEVEACAQLNGIAAESVKLAGNQTQRFITSGSVVAIRLTGNQSTLSLELKGAVDAYIAGLCVFLAGNQSDALIINHTQVGRLVYVGRGNQSHAEFQALAGSSLSTVIGDLAGNQAGLSISGEGDYSCGNVRLRGRSATYSCR